MGANVSTVMVVVALAAGLWWGFSRKASAAPCCELFSMAALALAVATLVVEGLRWQLVPWQVLALAVAAAAALRRWRPGHSRRWRRVVGRGVLVVGLALGGLALLTALVPKLPKPSGPHSVGSVIFRWTDNQRPETLTADPSDRRQVIAQAWYPTDATQGRAVPYFEAQGHLPSSISRAAVLHVRARSGASRLTRPSRRRSAPRSEPGPCCCSRPGCRSRASSTRRSAPTLPVAATWSSRSASRTSQRSRFSRAARSSVRRPIRT